MAAMHTVTVTCPGCGEPIQCPVILTAGSPVVSPVDGRLIVPVTTKADTSAIADHQCPDDELGPIPPVVHRAA